MCRGEIITPIEITSKLVCYYETNGKNPYLLLAPFKVEEAYKKPRILIFHDVITDSEIATIKKLAHPRVSFFFISKDMYLQFVLYLQFRRATVQNSLTGELQTAQYRISKSAWLKEGEHKYVADVCRRVSDMTNLTVETAEELQVVNYGIGGHYEPHFDFARV